MTSPLIFIPKKVTSDVDFAPQLRQVIQRSYGESPDAYNEELQQLNRARQDALRGSAGSDVTARDLLYKYFGQLELLELRFPELRVPFPWNDAFTHVKISQLSLAYEKASVIFNIGATLASLAAAAPRSSPEGLKRAYHAFRCAAGMFTYINDNFLHAPSTDLSREVVKVLVSLMTAQATEVFIETMGPPTTKGAGLRSKLCWQASSLYSGIVEEVKEWVTKGVFIREWSLLVQTKAKLFASLAQYYRSIADTTAGKYGDALARLALADTAAKEATRLAGAFTASFSTSSTVSSLGPDAPVALVELTKTHSALVVDARTKAQKENDIVYNDVVPSEASLAPLEKGKDVAEPIAIHDVYASADVQKIVGPDLFIKLVPLSVHESASMYSEEKAKLVRAEVERTDLADGELAAALEYMGLPASLERFRGSGGGGGGAASALADPTPQVRGWADEVRQAASGAGSVDNLFSRLEQLRSTCTSQLDAAVNVLEQDSLATEHARARYGPTRFTQAPSGSGSTERSIKADVKARKSEMEAARRADDEARRLWDTARGDVLVLASEDRLVGAFGEAVAGAGAGGGGSATGLVDLMDGGGEKEDGEERAREESTKARVSKISDALSKLSKVKKERADVLKDLKERVQADDISHVLILNRKGSAALEPALFASELEKFRPHQQRLAQTVHVQQATLNEISAEFGALTSDPRAKASQERYAAQERRQRELVGRLGRAAQAHAEVRRALEKGLTFYSDLGAIASSLKEQADGFVAHREAERQDMEAHAAVQMRLEGATSPLGSAGAGGASTYGLERGMGSLDIGGQGFRSPAPPVSAAISYAPRSSPAAPPPSSSPSPYASMPMTGAFANAHGGHSVTASSPPPPPLPPQMPAPPRQPSFPPPPSKPTSSHLPPPPTPMSYQSQPGTQSYGGSQQQLQQQHGSGPGAYAAQQHYAQSSSSPGYHGPTGQYGQPQGPLGYNPSQYGHYSTTAAATTSSSPPPPPPAPVPPQHTASGYPQSGAAQYGSGYGAGAGYTGGMSSPPPPPPPSNQYYRGY